MKVMRVTVCLTAILLTLVSTRIASGDSLVTTDGERFIGKIVQESPEHIVIESPVVGKLTIPRDRVRELHHDSTGVDQPSTKPTTRPATRPWLPAGLATDGFDWIELKSGEWLKGRLKYVEKKVVEIQSEELEAQKFKLKNVKSLYPAKPMYTKFEELPAIFAPVKIEDGQVTVDTQPEPLVLPTDQLTGISPGGKRERDYWFGDLTLGMNLQAGNTRQFDLNANISLSRRTPVTRIDLDYLANFSIVNDVQNAENQRFDANYDVLLGKGFFIRPVDLDYYRDPLANIRDRLTAGLGCGYYIFDEDDLEWNVSAGPSYQSTWFQNVPEGQPEYVSAPGALVATSFSAKLTDRLELLLGYNGNFTSRQSGSIAQHAETTLKFKFTRNFDINLSFIWDRTEYTQKDAAGVRPKTDDYRTVLGVGWDF